jgi:hypothetical protein
LAAFFFPSSRSLALHDVTEVDDEQSRSADLERLRRFARRSRGGSGRIARLGRAVSGGLLLAPARELDPELFEHRRVLAVDRDDDANDSMASE